MGIGLILSGCGSKSQSDKSDSSAEKSGLTLNGLEETNPRTIEIDFGKALPISKNLVSVNNISFDESCDDIIGMPHHIVVSGDTIFAIDPVKSPGLYAYHKDGSQIFAYCSEGGGPEDISSPMNLMVRDNDIVVFDFASKKLLYFSKQGQFIKSVSVPIDALSATLDSSQGIWVDYSNQEYDDIKLSWIKDSISPQQKILEVPEHLKGMTVLPIATLLNIPDNGLRYYPALETKIYAISEGATKVIYELDFKGKWPSEEEFIANYSGNDWAPKMRKFPIRTGGFAEDRHWLVLGYTYQQSCYIVVYDKLKNETSIFEDSEDKYYNPLYVDGFDLYILCQDGNLDILKLK